MTGLNLSQHTMDRTDLAGKAIVVTGGTNGIGRATARKLVRAGARVLIFGRQQAELDRALAEMKPLGEVRGLTAEAARQGDLERVFREADQALGGVDILVNNHAVSGGSITEGQYADWLYAVQVNLVGYMACVRLAIDRMKQRGGGHILCVGSMSADLREPGADVYVATKAAIQALCESLRKTVNKQGIRVSLVEPGAVDTPLQEKPGEKKRQEIEEQSMILAEDIAESVFYCLTQPPRVDVVSLQVRPVMQLI